VSRGILKVSLRHGVPGSVGRLVLRRYVSVDMYATFALTVLIQLKSGSGSLLKVFWF
jgi:hypothetical protein